MSIIHNQKTLSRVFSIKAVFCLFALLGAGYFLAVNTGFYWRNLWVDVPLHFLGGFAAALAGTIYFKNQLKDLDKFAVFIFIIGFSLLIGVFWEFFEWGMDVFVKAKINQASVSDTLGDLLMDLLGAASAALIYLLQNRSRM